MNYISLQSVDLEDNYKNHLYYQTPNNNYINNDNLSIYATNNRSLRDVKNSA